MEFIIEMVTLIFSKAMEGNPLGILLACSLIVAILTIPKTLFGKRLDQSYMFLIAAILLFLVGILVFRLGMY